MDLLYPNWKAMNMFAIGTSLAILKMWSISEHLFWKVANGKRKICHRGLQAILAILNGFQYMPRNIGLWWWGAYHWESGKWPRAALKSRKTCSWFTKKTECTWEWNDHVLQIFLSFSKTKGSGDARRRTILYMESEDLPCTVLQSTRHQPWTRSPCLSNNLWTPCSGSKNNRAWC